MNWVVYVTKSAKKQLSKLPTKDSQRVDAAIDVMDSDPFFGDLQKLGGHENRWRRRVGNYRIFFLVLSQERTIYIYNIKRRASNTY